MCGIAGVAYLDRESAVDSRLVKRMCERLVHRGPDDEGLYTDHHVGLGMRRLRIIDLATGQQPMANEDRSVWIVYNGEIYNYLDLRPALEARGHRFATRSDTETIVHAYEEWGDACVDRLRGMFAFAIWDQRRDRLLLARDRLGIKPLYYVSDSRQLAFASELKALLELPDLDRELDLEALDDYLTFEYIGGAKTIFKRIRKLPPGHVLVAEGGRVTVRRYWDVPGAVDENRTATDYCRDISDTLAESVRIHLLSDVPLGALLSGGIDSSSVVALMSRFSPGRVESFSLGFRDPSYDELPYARLVARQFGTDHHEEIVEPDAVGLATRLIQHLDEPFADVSIFPTYLVSRLARERVTVALSGDGGDELFAGYDTYLADRGWGLYRRLPRLFRAALEAAARPTLRPSDQKRGWRNMAGRFLGGGRLPEELEHARWLVYLTGQGKQTLYSDGFRSALGAYDPFHQVLEHFERAPFRDRLARQLYVDLKTYLPDDILVKVDRMSMANSLETRVPLLDHVFVERVAAIPSRLKLRHLTRKYIFKRAMAPLLPPAILGKRKEGFSIPMKTWLRRELRPLMLEVLAEAEIERQGYFRWPAINRLLTEHLAGRENHAHRLWALMVFQLWSRLYRT
ncbi:MAG TPA: asparagine synthase (glutamine-hydrolyzing) [Methylomirabilota bacterium]|jgi:asparagine synthase (glutamine-hydrolysing)|nr:asparagine synthase (glutamine-hydrolyzing) [Methylomirabilota bacterium]